MPREPPIKRARALRRAMTPPEAALWEHLRRENLGFKFRHQHPIGPYTLDFFCRSAGVAVEVDGAGHQLEVIKKKDAHRDRWLSEKGIRTLRFGANEIRSNLTGVLTRIQQECASRSPSTG
jgi:very-short-patch-repair endonuclease